MFVTSFNYPVINWTLLKAVNNIYKFLKPLLIILIAYAISVISIRDFDEFEHQQYSQLKSVNIADGCRHVVSLCPYLRPVPS